MNEAKEYLNRIIKKEVVNYYMITFDGISMPLIHEVVEEIEESLDLKYNIEILCDERYKTYGVILHYNEKLTKAVLKHFNIEDDISNMNLMFVNN